MTASSIAIKSVYFVGYWIRLAILVVIALFIFSYNQVTDLKTITFCIISACGALHLIISFGEPFLELTQAERDSVGNTTAFANLLFITWILIVFGNIIDSKDITLTIFVFQSISLLMFTARTWQNLGIFRMIGAIIFGTILWMFISSIVNRGKLL